MKKQTTTKIISKLIIFVFVVSFFQFTSLTQAATDTSMSSLYSNPNQSSNNTYKFKISDVVSSQMLTNIVGCTGVVNKVAEWMAKFIQSPFKIGEMADDAIEKMREQLSNACGITVAALQTAGQIIPTIGGLAEPIQKGFETVGECQKRIKETNDKEMQKMIDEQNATKARDFKEQCFDGIAITLAKNQLTSMTRSMMNWVNSGYGGNPFFVQNIQDFTYNFEKNILDTGIDILLTPGNQNPYAYDFSRSVITGRGLLSGSSNFLGGLQSDLEAFIVDPQTYYTDNQLDKAMNTEEALLRAQRANYAFQNDFSSGGWNGWLALTQRDQNNPLGFTMLASQYLADTQMQKVTAAKDELAQNNGFMSQKTCILWNQVDEETGDYIYGQNFDPNTGEPDGGVILTTTHPQPQDECVDWKVITPGSIIKEKTTNYLNSPERQLELAKTINDSLNALFSILLSKLEGGGLMGLSDAKVITNWNDNLNELASLDGNTPYSNNGAYDGFNLTQDLGNNYIYDTPIELGTWNATTNIATLSNKANETYSKEINANIKLYPGTAPEIYTYNSDTKEKELAYPTNPFYTVTTAGKTKLINEGYNGWAKDDRAFWNGREWQNWKKGQTNPIEKRGVIQIQQDYIVAGKEILGVLPNVMTKLGELDYCIPGPNPSYKTNSTDAQSAYQSWIGSMYVGPRDEYRTEWRIDLEDTRTYNNLANIFTDNPNTWKAVLASSSMWLLDNFARAWVFAAGWDCWVPDGDNDPPPYCQNYHFKANTQEMKDVENRKKLMEETFDLVNNHLFQDFYKTFDERMNKLYFNNMVNKYIDTETSIGEKLNSAYIPMAESGLDLTKNILYYGNDITKAMQEYTDAMTQAKINISKLEPIKTEVSGIIKTAQDRRNKELVDKLGLSLNAIQKRYASCFAEENISFYDPDEITKGSVSVENCNDGIDNDLNGLIDILDPVCPGYVASRRTNNNNTLLNNNGTVTTCKPLVTPPTVTPTATIVYNFYGVADEDINAGSMGNIVTGGEFTGIDTSKFGYIDQYGLPATFSVYLSTTTPGQTTTSSLNRPLTATNSLYVGEPNIIDSFNGSILIKGQSYGSTFQVKAEENLERGDIVSVSDYIEGTATSAGVTVVKKAIGK